ncbi:helix-turn-helix domain-containing protein [Parachryseolinea silvisoli]|uniref:helix-turn-helix domain-containing protein n=1 Tax=Parachryseolinea silvisoli TaxID=2873601 RepID=UPI002265A493|nr:helix-turn-helix transcriptional regulator [Parachryseolinea silvisoli]MCD9015184.1 helix-turn-helix domain-containing protein [Parachryseolinea silvisoli]
MTDAQKPSRAVHHGKNLKRFREMLGYKQEAFADKLGGDWTVRKISYYENKEVIEAELIEELAKALSVPADAILNFDEEKAVYNIQHNYDNTSGSQQNYQPTFIPLDKYDQLMDEIRKLYEALLQSEREKNALLERLLSEKSK